MKSNRIESYLVLAATPAVIGSIATADVYHYDGPAISVSTGGLPLSSFSGTLEWKSFVVGGGSMIGTVFMDVNAWRGSFSEFGRSAGLEGSGSSNVYGGFIADKGPGGIKPNAQRFSYSAKMPGKNMPSPKAKIGGSSHHSASSSSFGEFNGDGEERGYIGIYMETKESHGFGWLDIGYDFASNTLTMYDWAFNDDGDLYAGHDTPPASVPGPTGLLALAVGAAGIRRKRNRVA